MRPLLGLLIALIVSVSSAVAQPEKHRCSKCKNEGTVPCTQTFHIMKRVCGVKYPHKCSALYGAKCCNGLGNKLCPSCKDPIAEFEILSNKPVAAHEL